MLTAREALWREFAKLHREVLAIVKEDQVCRRLMTVPGVGALVSLTYRGGVDDPARFAKSKSVGAVFGLTPKRYQSGETDVTGAITNSPHRLLNCSDTSIPTWCSMTALLMDGWSRPSTWWNFRVH